MKRFLRLIIIALITFFIVKASTFGWHFGDKCLMAPLEENKGLSELLKSHVYQLAEKIGERSVFKYEQLNQAAEYITGQFRSFGYDLEFQSYSVLNKAVKNIIATKRGTQRPEEIVIVGAHYDSCFNPGADDNASAVAGLIELARLISHQSTERSVKFIAFVNEEPPFFKTKDMGSRIYAKEAKAKGEDIRAVLILEMIGYYSDKPHSQRYPPFYGLFYPNKGNFIGVIGNFRSSWLVKQVVKSFKNQSRFSIESVITFAFVPGVDFSDHWSFWQEGYPAVMLTDTSFYRNPHYHAASDTYDTLNYASAAEVIRGLTAALLEIAK